MTIQEAVKLARKSSNKIRRGKSRSFLVLLADGRVESHCVTKCRDFVSLSNFRLSEVMATNWQVVDDGDGK